MVTSITENIELTAIELYDWKTHFKKCSVEYVNDHRKEQLSDMNWQIISGGNIKKIRWATSLEFYEHLVYPNLPYYEKELFDEVKRNIPENKLDEVTYNQVIMAMENRKKQEKYYDSINTVDTEKIEITNYIKSLSEAEYKKLYAEWEKLLKHDFWRETAIIANMRKIVKDRTTSS